MRRAVIDVGSNSVLLLVAERHGQEWKPLRETSKVTALGAGVKEARVLSEDRISDTLAAIKAAFNEATHHDAQVRAYGTMALRLAENANEFLTRADAQGTPVAVISGEAEAELGFESVAADPLFNGRNPTVVDVGGHSTEVSSASGRASYPVGTLGLRSAHLRDEAPQPGAILTASAALDEAFAALEPAKGAVVGLGASVTNLVTIRGAMTKWDPDAVHGAFLDYEEVSRFVGYSMRLTDTERAAIVGIEPGRERTIHIGALILERALLALAAEGIYASVRGWRHAMLDRWD